MPNGIVYNPDGSVIMDNPQLGCVHYDNTEHFEDVALPAMETITDELKCYVHVEEDVGDLENPNIGVLRVTNNIGDTIGRLYTMIEHHYDAQDINFGNDIVRIIREVEDGYQTISNTIEYNDEGFDTEDPDGHHIREIKFSRTWIY